MKWLLKSLSCLMTDDTDSNEAPVTQSGSQLKSDVTLGCSTAFFIQIHHLDNSNLSRIQPDWGRSGQKRNLIALLVKSAQRESGQDVG